MTVDKKILIKQQLTSVIALLYPIIKLMDYTMQNDLEVKAKKINKKDIEGLVELIGENIQDKELKEKVVYMLDVLLKYEYPEDTLKEVELLFDEIIKLLIMVGEFNKQQEQEFINQLNLIIVKDNSLLID